VYGDEDFKRGKHHKDKAKMEAIENSKESKEGCWGKARVSEIACAFHSRSSRVVVAHLCPTICCDNSGGWHFCDVL
jgi:hypothetical protein